MGKVQEQEKRGFWARYKFYIIGVIGAVLLIGSMSVQNVALNYVTPDGKQYAVKLDYSAYGLCLRCNVGTKNVNDIVEKEMFFCVPKNQSIKNAARGIQEIAQNTEGTFQIYVGGVLGNNSKTAQKIVDLLQSSGYKAELLKAP